MLYNDILDAWICCRNLKVVAEGLEKLLFSKWSLKTGPAEIIAVMEWKNALFNQGRWQNKEGGEIRLQSLQASAESWRERGQCLSASVLMLKRTLTWQISVSYCREPISINNTLGSEFLDVCLVLLQQLPVRTSLRQPSPSLHYIACIFQCCTKTFWHGQLFIKKREKKQTYWNSPLAFVIIGSSWPFQ